MANPNTEHWHRYEHTGQHLITTIATTTTFRSLFSTITIVLAMATSPSARSQEGEQQAVARDVYMAQCARCHQRDGTGIEGVYPPLRNAPALWQDRATVIRGVLAGRPAATMDAPQMPTHGYLGNETIAATLTFLLLEWGPGGRPYTTEEVAAERLKLLEHHPASIPDLPATSPLTDMDAVQYVTSTGPPMTAEEFQRARELYYGHCTGCHGVLREGTAGNPLVPELMRARGTEYLQSVIGFGSSSGMPGWGTTAQLSAEDINLLARFLQHPVPQAPDMTLADLRASWRVFRTTKQRTESPGHDYRIDDLFVVTLHDVAQLAIINGPTRELIATVPTGGSPHRVRLSESGRYLYVICRDGTLSLIDLYSSPPTRVAQVRIGYEARAVGASRYPGFEDRYVLAGAYWPPQLVLLDGLTLEPLRLVSTRGRATTDGGYHPEPRVSDVAGSFAHPEFIAQIKETGHVYLFPYPESSQLRIVDVAAPTELRAGSFSLDNRYYLTPADSNAVSVLDTRRQSLAATVPARVFGAGAGVSYLDPEFGPAWMTAGMLGDEIIAIGTDPKSNPNFAWRPVRTLKGPGNGSMFLATHPDSPHIWLDAPLNRDPAISGSVAVFDKADLGAGYRSLAVAPAAGLGGGPQRVLQPAFDASGKEVWLVVWNPQNLNSALVVFDDEKLEVLAIVDDPRLITPTRIYNLGRLRERRVKPAMEE